MTEPSRGPAEHGAQNAHNPHNPRNPAEHLKPHRWAKGRSGNPGGRPRGRSVTAALRDLAKSSHNGKRLYDLLAERLMREALGGKFHFLKEVVERLDGKVGPEAPAGAAPMPTLFICPPPRVLGEHEALPPGAERTAKVVPQYLVDLV